VENERFDVKERPRKAAVMEHGNESPMVVVRPAIVTIKVED